MAKTSPEIREHAQSVLDYLNEHPHSQSVFYLVEDHAHEDDSWKLVEIDDSKGVCNTTLCVAGASAWLYAGKKGLSVFSRSEDEGALLAGTRLGLEKEEYEYLFYDTSDIAAKNIVSRIARGYVSGIPSR